MKNVENDIWMAFMSTSIIPNLIEARLILIDISVSHILIGIYCNIDIGLRRK